MKKLVLVVVVVIIVAISVLYFYGNAVVSVENMWNELNEICELEKYIRENEDYNNAEEGEKIYKFNNRYSGKDLVIEGYVYREGVEDFYVSKNIKEDERNGRFDNNIFNYPLIDGKASNAEVKKEIEGLEYMQKVTLIGKYNEETTYPPVFEITEIVAE